MHLKLKAK